MKKSMLCSLASIVVCITIAGSVQASQEYFAFSDTGEVAWNGAHPIDGDHVTEGGWSYDQTGDGFGEYSDDAGNNGSERGIRLKGHGTFIESPSFSALWGTAYAETRIIEATGGVPNQDALSALQVCGPGGVLVQLGPRSGDFNFWWQINDGSSNQSGVISDVSCNNSNWWEYTIEFTPDRNAIFTVFDGADSGYVEVYHGITVPFTNYRVVVDRLSSGSEVAVADYDNLSFAVTPVPEPSTLVFFGTGIVGVFGFVARKRIRRA